MLTTSEKAESMLKSPPAKAGGMTSAATASDLPKPQARSKVSGVGVDKENALKRKPSVCESNSSKNAPIDSSDEEVENSLAHKPAAAPAAKKRKESVFHGDLSVSAPIDISNEEVQKAPATKKRTESKNASKQARDRASTDRGPGYYTTHYDSSNR